MSLKTGSFRFGDFVLDADEGVLGRNENEISLPPKALKLLCVLIENSGHIVEKAELIEKVWGDTFVEEGNLAYTVRLLRKALGDDPETPKFIQTLPKRGYRFIAKVDEVSNNASDVGRQVTLRFETSGGLRNKPVNGNKSYLGSGTARQSELTAPSDFPQTSDAASNSRARRLFVNRASFAVAVVAVVLVAGGWWLWHRFTTRPQPVPERLMLAVLPFQNLTGDPGQEYFSDGLTEEMIAQLGSIDPQQLGVIGRTSVMHFKDSQMQLTQIGNELGVQYVLEGSVRRDLEYVRVTAQLIQVRDQTHVWARQYDRELRSSILLQSEIAREVASAIQLTINHDKQTEGSPHAPSFPENYEAYDLYVKGQHFLNKRTAQSLEQAIEYFQQATTKDPNYARAYVGLANSYTLLGGYTGRPQTEFVPKARAAALRALEIDENSPEAHAALALIVQNYDWDLQTAEEHFRQAIKLNDNYSTAHHWYAEHLTWQCRFDEAFREYERALELDPLSLIIATDYGVALVYAREYDRAIERFRAVREIEPNFGRTTFILFAYVEKGLFDDALADIKMHRASFGEAWYWEALTYVYGRSGKRTQAQQALEKLLKLNENEQVDPIAIAWAHVSTGDNDKAFAWLEKAYAEHGNLITLKSDPRYDPLRNDPRFKDLLHRVGLDQ